jgi:DNA-binding MurR/RpiR family transcriptional regulator
MAESTEDILEQIVSILPSLSKAQRKVANYIINEPLDSSFSTVHQLSRKTGASTATIVRLATTLNFEGFIDFQNTLKRYLYRKTTPVSRLENFRPLKSGDDNLLARYHLQCKNLEETMNNLTSEHLHNAAKLLCKAVNIFVIGARSCYSLAHFLYFNINRIFNNCDLINLNDDSYTQVNRMKPGDVLIAATFPRYGRRVVSIAQIAKARRVSVIGITDSYTSPLAEFCDILFRASTYSNNYHNSLMSAMLIVDLLLPLLADSDRKRTKKNLAGIDKILYTFNSFINR